MTILCSAQNMEVENVDLFLEWFTEGRHTIVLPSYLQHMEDFLDSRQLEAEGELERATSEGDKSHLNTLLQYEVPESRRFLRESYVITLIAFSEGRLRWLCKRVYEESSNISKSPEQYGLHRSTLKRIKRYLTHEAKIGFDFGKSAHWQDILNYKKIRDDLVHNGGYVNKSEDYIKTAAAVGVDRGRIRLSGRFCEEATDAVAAFLDELVFHTIEHQNRHQGEA